MGKYVVWKLRWQFKYGVGYNIIVWKILFILL